MKHPSSETIGLIPLLTSVRNILILISKYTKEPRRKESLPEIGIS